MASKFVTDYPELTISFVSLLCTLLVTLFTLWLRSMKQHINKHIDREESIIWPKIEGRFTSIDGEIQDLKVEVVKVTSRLQSLEDRMPDGDIKEIKEAVLELVGRK